MAQAITAGLLFLSPVCSAADSALIIQVENDAHIPGRILSQAEVLTQQIFHDAGVQTRWTGPGIENACRSAMLGVRILSSSSTLREAPDALGVAVVSDRPENSWLADIFYGAIAQRVVTRSETVVLLANVIAHEVGHLLLGPNHSAGQLMRGEWVNRGLNSPAKLSPLRFDRGEARQLLDAASTRLNTCIPRDPNQKAP
jgi:hypothetical protein